MTGLSDPKRDFRQKLIPFKTTKAEKKAGSHVNWTCRVEAYKSSKLTDVHWLRSKLNKETSSNDSESLLPWNEWQIVSGLSKDDGEGMWMSFHNRKQRVTCIRYFKTKTDGRRDEGLGRGIHGQRPCKFNSSWARNEHIVWQGVTSLCTGLWGVWITSRSELLPPKLKPSPQRKRGKICWDCSVVKYMWVYQGRYSYTHFIKAVSLPLEVGIPTVGWTNLDIKAKHNPIISTVLEPQTWPSRWGLQEAVSGKPRCPGAGLRTDIPCLRAGIFSGV